MNTFKLLFIGALINLFLLQIILPIATGQIGTLTEAMENIRSPGGFNSTTDINKISGVQKDLLSKTSEDIQKKPGEGDLGFVGVLLDLGSFIGGILVSVFIGFIEIDRFRVLMGTGTIDGLLYGFITMVISFMSIFNILNVGMIFFNRKAT